MEIFLRLKHWHVFILGFGLLLISFVVVTMLDDMTRQRYTYSPLVPAESLLRVTLFMQTLCTTFAYFWLYAVGNYLHKRRHYNSFALMLFRLGIYFATFFNIARYVVFPALEVFNGTFNQLGLGFALLCRVYGCFIAARLLNSVEEQRDVSFREIFRDFLAFLFYPVGVWQLQPRINKIYDNDKEVIPDPDAPLDQSVR